VVFGIAAGEPLALPVVAVPDPPPELIPVDDAPVAFDFFTASELVLVIAGLFMLSGCAAGPVLWAYEPPINPMVNAPVNIAIFNISASSLVCERDQPDRWRNVPGNILKPGTSRCSRTQGGLAVVKVASRPFRTLRASCAGAKYYRPSLRDRLTASTHSVDASDTRTNWQVLLQFRHL
jgi:hypothetical protein